MDFYCRLDNAEVIAEPFPYLVLENVFEQDLCERLIREMPSLDVLTRGASLESNKRFSLSQQEALPDQRVSATL